MTLSTPTTTLKACKLTWNTRTQVDAQGKRFSTNTEADGQFQSKWLNMMYPRLYIARNLLRDDGVIFISVDDHELDNLKKLCNEVFGEHNFIANAVWQKA